MSDASTPAFPESPRIFITGAGGFVGRHLIAHLLTEAAPTAQIIAATFHQSVPLGTDPDAFGAAGWQGGSRGGRIATVELDITEAARTAKAIAEAQPTHIVHLAGRASGADADREAVFAANAAGTRHVLDAAAALSPFPRTLVVSTGYVYGNCDRERPAREEDPIGPLWKFGAYVDSKMEMENVTKAYRGFAITARPFAHTGPGQPPQFALPSFARQLARIERALEPPEIKVGNLDVQRDMLDVRDVVRAYALLLTRGVPGEAVNIATGQPHTMRSLLDTLRKACLVPTVVTVDPARVRPADLSCSTGDSSRLRHLTGWEPRYSLETTLRDTLAYWREQTG